MQHPDPAGRRSLMRTPARFAARTKPLMRGWFHAAGAVAAVSATIALLVQTSGDVIQLVALGVFGLSMIVLYVVSSLYHIGRWNQRQERFLRAFDHANIFVFIAGAYTPFCMLVLNGWVRVAMLVTVWTLAILGVVFSVVSLRLPRWATIFLYIGMGWLSLVLLPQIASALSLAPVLLLLGGGLLYTIGAVIYAMRWPDPIPWLFGYHEIFHLLVVGGTVATTVTIWYWVIPFARL